MARVESYRDLEIWTDGIEFVSKVYELTRSLPVTERYNIATQLNRAATSVPCNIAEGWGRGRGASQANFIKMARGSLFECDTLLEVVGREYSIHCESARRLQEGIATLGRKLNSYLTWLQTTYVREEIEVLETALISTADET